MISAFGTSACVSCWMFSCNAIVSSIKPMDTDFPKRACEYRLMRKTSWPIRFARLVKSSVARSCSAFQLLSVCARIHVFSEIQRSSCLSVLLTLLPSNSHSLDWMDLPDDSICCLMS